METLVTKIHEVFDRRLNNLCSKKDYQIWKAELEELTKTERERWDRLLIKHDAEIKKLRRRYELPLYGSAARIFWNDYNKFKSFQYDFDRIEWDLSPSDLTNLRFWILYNHGLFYSMGYPAGNFNLEPIITKTTFPTNPIIQEAIFRLKVMNDPPPRPKIIDGKVDPQPLIEWHKRHPEVYQKEIADILEVHEVTVSRWLSPSKPV